MSDLVDEEFEIPPFFIFPSWEKSLEAHDQKTQTNTIQLITDLFSNYVDEGISAFEDIMEYGDKSPDLFLKKIEESNLFISPGGEIGESLKIALDNYKQHISIWRSREFCDELFSLSDTKIITNAIFERVQPQYHLLKNSDELKSHPYLCIETQAHYYQLIANMKNKSFFDNTDFDSSTAAILKSLTSRKLNFLANIPDSQLVSLRKTKENIAFRRELRDLVNSLPDTKLDDLGYVASEVCSHIELAISKHEKQVSALNDKYAAKHKYTALI